MVFFFSVCIYTKQIIYYSFNRLNYTLILELKSFRLDHHMKK